MARRVPEIDADAAARALRDVLRDELGIAEASFRQPPVFLADGVTARAFALEIEGLGPLVLRVFRGEQHLPPDQARVESALQNALADLGYPAPRVLACGDAGSPFGAPFMLMERVRGPNAMAPALLAGVAAVAIGLAGSWIPLLVLLAASWSLMARLLLRLHALPLSALRDRLAQSGVDPERLSVAALLDRMQEWSARSGRIDLQAVVAWLRERAPSSGAGEVACHGDFWFGNVILGPRGLALLDWTQARLSFPELDLAWMRIQHYGRAPLAFPGPDLVYDALSALLRPFAWLLFGANALVYRVVRPVDAGRLRYFTALCAAGIYLSVLERRDRCDPEQARRDALLQAWGSPITRALLRRRLRGLTGLAL
jgi:aminoglycoside phosphotransferase (APT) family kinase protein